MKNTPNFFKKHITPAFFALLLIASPWARAQGQTSQFLSQAIQCKLPAARANVIPIELRRLNAKQDPRIENLYHIPRQMIAGMVFDEFSYSAADDTSNASYTASFPGRTEAEVANALKIERTDVGFTKTTARYELQVTTMDHKTTVVCAMF